MIKLIAIKKVENDWLVLSVENAFNSQSIGDWLWISENGSEMWINMFVDPDQIDEIINLFESSHRRAVRGIFMRVGIL